MNRTHFQSCSSHNLAQLVNDARSISYPVSEPDMLYLQTACTTPGFHAIHTKTVSRGRYIINEVLSLLKWHTDVAFLSKDHHAFTHNTIKNQNSFIYKTTNIVGQLSNFITNDLLETFFIDEFYFDFLWIEATNELLFEPWLEHFEYLLSNYHIHRMIPIVVISYME